VTVANGGSGYSCGLVRHSEWICFEHPGYARQKAEAWWQLRSSMPVPNTVAEALRATHGLAMPTAILVRPRGAFAEIVNHRFELCNTRASVPSAAASPEVLDGSMHVIGSATADAMRAIKSFAQSSARTSRMGEQG